MKTLKYILIASATFLFLQSCSKHNDDSELNTIKNQLEGRYNLESAFIEEGGAIDLNGDGNMSENLLTESFFSQNICKLVVSDASKPKNKEHISLYLPVMGAVTSENEIISLLYAPYGLTFSALIEDSSLSVTPEVEVDYSDYLNRYDNVSFDISKLEDGYISVHSDAVFYDWTTKSKKNVKAVFTFFKI